MNGKSEIPLVYYFFNPLSKTRHATQNFLYLTPHQLDHVLIHSFEEGVMGMERWGWICSWWLWINEVSYPSVYSGACSPSHASPMPPDESKLFLLLDQWVIQWVLEQDQLSQ